MATSLRPLHIRRVLGRDDWAPPEPFGPDGWRWVRRDGSGSVIVTCSDATGDDWIHASIAWADHMPEYADLTLLHRAVFGDGWAYQVFAPPADHINIHQYALHLWGRLDGQAALPDFTNGSRSI